MMSVLLRQAILLDEHSAFHKQKVDIYIKDGVIQNIDKQLTIASGKELAFDGDYYVSPGFIDIFADYCEPGYEHKETLLNGLDVAAKGGFTQVFTTPNTQPSVSNKSAVKYIQSTTAAHIVKVHPLGAVSQKTEGKDLAEMLDMRRQGAIAFSDGWQPVQNANLLLKALEYVKAFDGILIQLPVEKSLSDGGLMHEGIVSTQIGMPGIPAIAETIAIQRDLDLLRYTGSRLHFTGVSSAEGLELIRQAKKEGLQVSCSVSPYHLALNDEILRNYESVYKVMPPIRSEQDRLALIEGIKDGTIDCICSHHRPQEWDSKAKEFEYAGTGMNVQQVAFAIAYTALGEHISLERLVQLFSRNPAALFGLDREELKENTRANLTIFSLSEGTILNEESNISLSYNNPFINKSLKGKILGIINNNQLNLS